MVKISSKALTLALKQSHLFSSLSDSQLERVCNQSKTKNLQQGEQLFSQGDKVNYFYLILSGKMKLFRISPDGQEKIFEIIPAGGLFGEALMFLDHVDYPVCSSALSETTVIGIDAWDFKRMLSESVDTCLFLLADMSRRLHQQINEIDALTLHNGTCRVASYLVNVSPDQDNYELDDAKLVIASRLSVTPETLSRIMKNFREQKILSINGKKITILNRPALQSLSFSP